MKSIRFYIFFKRIAFNSFTMPGYWPSFTFKIRKMKEGINMNEHVLLMPRSLLTKYRRQSVCVTFYSDSSPPPPVFVCVSGITYLWSSIAEMVYQFHGWDKCLVCPVMVFIFQSFIEIGLYSKFEKMFFCFSVIFRFFFIFFFIRTFDSFRHSIDNYIKHEYRSVVKCNQPLLIIQIYVYVNIPSKIGN